MRILLVTYNWPPRNAMGTHRPYSWAREWTLQGADITVLTAEKHTFDDPLDLCLADLDGVRVVQVSYLGTGKRHAKQHRPLGQWVRKLIPFLKHLRFRLAGSIGLNIDIRSRWTSPAFHVAKEMFREKSFDVVVSTYGPKASHTIASRLKSEFPSLCWVADYRDLWSGRQDVLRKRSAHRLLFLLLHQAGSLRS